MEDSVTLQLSLPVSLKDRLRNINARTGIAMSKIIRDVLDEHLIGVEKRYGIQIPLDLSAERRSETTPKEIP